MRRWGRLYNSTIQYSSSIQYNSTWSRLYSSTVSTVLCSKTWSRLAAEHSKGAQFSGEKRSAPSTSLSSSAIFTARGSRVLSTAGFSRQFGTDPSSSTTTYRSLCTGPRLEMPVTAYTAEERGTVNTTSYQVYLKDAEGPISPFHDIPLVANTDTSTYHAVIEIPRWTNEKMEINTKAPLNPIVQDQKKGKLRFVANSFPHHGYIWNYGAFPQTWENPNHVDSSTGYKGDNDPVDMIEIGHRIAKRGDVLEVKVLGTLAMVDDGETDWKMVCIDVNDPLASELVSLEDVEREMPGFLDATREWFRIYKMPDGKPENCFAFDGEFQDSDFARKVLEETHLFWRQMMGLEETHQDYGDICIESTRVEGVSAVLSPEGAATVLESSPQFLAGNPREDSVDTWHYTHLK